MQAIRGVLPIGRSSDTFAMETRLRDYLAASRKAFSRITAARPRVGMMILTLWAPG